MRPFKKIAVLGDGGWGTTLAVLLDKKGLQVTLWSAFAAYARLLASRRMNPLFLNGVRIPRSVRITADAEEALACDLVVLAVPSEYLRGVLSKAARFYSRRTPVISVVKGIENRSLLRMSQVVRHAWKASLIGVLSGPTIAQEVAHGIPTTAVVSSQDKDFMLALQHLFATPAFRIYANPDVVGVELGGSLKNIIAIACGISDGLGYGTNTKAAIVSRGLAEMARLGTAMGAKKETFMGLSGLGDLVTTCFNPLSRNHFVGERIGKGFSLKQISAKMKMIAEGVPTAKAACGLARKFGVDMPISNEIYHVLFKNRPPRLAVKNLMLRQRKAE